MEVIMSDLILNDKINQYRYLFFKWRISLPFINKLLLSIMIACLTGIAAQIKIFVPWSPVPVTGQTLAVLLSGVLLGRYFGGISMTLYLCAGIAGVPWFSGWKSGYAALLGPTGGYLIGFIVAALFLGHVIDTCKKSKNVLPLLGIMVFSNFILIYVPGLAQLDIWYRFIVGDALTFNQLLAAGFYPFIIGDLIKIFSAVFISYAITPKNINRDDI
jgi:biotin transport system substrate-specific component